MYIGSYKMSNVFTEVCSTCASCYTIAKPYVSEDVANRDMNPPSKSAQHMGIVVKSKIKFCKYFASRCKMQNQILQICCKSLQNAKSNSANSLQLVATFKIHCKKSINKQ